jgi:hypothetical protein
MLLFVVARSLAAAAVDAAPSALSTKSTIDPYLLSSKSRPAPAGDTEGRASASPAVPASPPAEPLGRCSSDSRSPHGVSSLSVTLLGEQEDSTKHNRVKAGKPASAFRQTPLSAGDGSLRAESVGVAVREEAVCCLQARGMGAALGVEIPIACIEATAQSSPALPSEASQPQVSVIARRTLCASWR